MGTQTRFIADSKVKPFIEALGKLRNCLNNLQSKSLDDSSVDEDKLYKDSSNLREHLLSMYTKLMTNNDKNLTEAQAFSDLNELWGTSKLLRNVIVGSQSREELLGITDD